MVAGFTAIRAVFRSALSFLWYISSTFLTFSFATHRIYFLSVDRFNDVRTYFSPYCTYSTAFFKAQKKWQGRQGSTCLPAISFLPPAGTSFFLFFFLLFLFFFDLVDEVVKDFFKFIYRVCLVLLIICFNYDLSVCACSGDSSG